MDNTPAPTPRVLTLTGTPHPKALVQSVDAVSGGCVFAWLNESGEQVDSGGSVARFTPSWIPSETPDERIYIEPADAELAAAIANPPAASVSPVVLTPLTILGRLTQAEEAALASSSDLAVSIVRNRLIAASEVRSDDPRTAEGKAILVAKGIITAERAAVIFS